MGEASTHPLAASAPCAPLSPMHHRCTCTPWLTCASFDCRCRIPSPPAASRGSEFVREYVRGCPPARPAGPPGLGPAGWVVAGPLWVPPLALLSPLRVWAQPRGVRSLLVRPERSVKRPAGIRDACVALGAAMTCCCGLDSCVAVWAAGWGTFWIKLGAFWITGLDNRFG